MQDFKASEPGTFSKNVMLKTLLSVVVGVGREYGMTVSFLQEQLQFLADNLPDYVLLNGNDISVSATLKNKETKTLVEFTEKEKVEN